MDDGDCSALSFGIHFHDILSAHLIDHLVPRA